MNKKEDNLQFDFFNLDEDFLKLTNSNSNDDNFQQSSTDFLNLLDTANNNFNVNNQTNYSIPQLSPDAIEHNFTNSSVLSGHNPELNMSPLQINSRSNNNNHNNHNSHNNHHFKKDNINDMIQSYNTPLQHATQNNLLEEFTDDEEYFTPLVSPAIPPTYDTTYPTLLTSNHQDHFSPLTSPALHPTSFNEQTALQQKLAFIERQQQHLRNIHHQLRPQNFKSPDPKPIKLQQKSPEFIAPATPSLLMKLGKRRKLSEEPKLASPRALAPLISPSLQPMDEASARNLLTTRSNYENLKEGKAKSLGIDFPMTIQSGIENRRSAHKAAEQKRRDTLKQSFDALRGEILDDMQDEDRAQREKDVRQMSKVVLLQHSYEYILRLKNDNRRKDNKIKSMHQELVSLRQQLGLPEITEEEKKQEEIERKEAEVRKEESLKRLKDIQESDD